MLQLAGSGVIGAVFIRRQLSLPAPMLPVDLFQRPIFALSVATSICSYTAQTLAYVGLPFLFQYAGGMSQIATGLLMTPWPFVVVFVAPLAGRLSDRYSAGLLGAIGLAVLTAGLLLLFFLAPGASTPTSRGGWRCAASASASFSRRTTAPS